MLCYDSQRRRIPCPTKEKIFREKCTPPRHCYPTSCYDIRRFLRTYEDREYTIYVRSMPKKIYCHDMSSSPKEFVTVNATENYSIYYDNKTYDPDKCPPESRDFEFSDKSSTPGRTSFRKIRIDLTTLRIDEKDFTFAESRGRPQSYGSAGDCYNRRKSCPQGDFSINLEHTGFHLRHGTVWELYGHHMVMKESNSVSTKPKKCWQKSLSSFFHFFSVEFAHVLPGFMWWLVWWLPNSWQFCFIFGCVMRTN